MVVGVIDLYQADVGFDLKTEILNIKFKVFFSRFSNRSKSNGELCMIVFID